MASRKTRTRKASEKKFDKSHPWHRERGPDGGFVSKAPALTRDIPIDESSLDFGPGTTEAELRRLEQAPFLELGSTGLRHYSGIIDEEFLPALRGRRSIQVFTEMRENDPTVGAMLFAVEMLMRHVEWRVEAGGEQQPADVELAEFVDSCRTDMSETWHDTLASMFSFLPFGFSVHEEVYKRRDGHNPQDPERDSQFADGRIGWRKLPVRAQDTIHRWIFDPNGSDELLGVVQLPPPTFTFRAIPASKFLLFRTTAAKANPQGRSILRNAYRPWYFKKKIEEIEGIGIERDLAGLPKMEVPAEIMSRTAPADKRALYAEIKAMLAAVRRDEREGILVPREFDKAGNALYQFDLVRSGGRRQFDTTAIVNRYDRHIASVVLADFILLGQQRVGSFALAETKTELFGYALGAWLDSVTEVFNRHAIPRLLLRNGLRVENPPKLVHGEVETIDLTELADFIAKLVAAGAPIFPDDEIENTLRMHAGLPEKTPETDEERKAREEEEEREALLELARLEAERNAVVPPGGPALAVPPIEEETGE